MRGGRYRRREGYGEEERKDKLMRGDLKMETLRNKREPEGGRESCDNRVAGEEDTRMKKFKGTVREVIKIESEIKKTVNRERRKIS